MKFMAGYMYSAFFIDYILTSYSNLGSRNCYCDNFMVRKMEGLKT